MNPITSHKLLLSFMLIMILLLMTFFGVTYITVKKTIADSQTDSVNLIKMRLLQALTDDMQNMETNQRGYILTGKNNLLQNFDSSMKAYPAKLALLKNIDPSDKKWMAQLDTLNADIEQKINLMNNHIRLFKLGKKEDLLKNILEGKGIQMMENIKQRVHVLEEEGRRELRNSANEKKNLAERTNLLFPLLGVAIFLTLIVFYLRIRYDIQQRMMAEDKLKKFNQELRTKVKEQTREIKEVFERMNDGIIALNKNWNITYLNKKGGEINDWNIEQTIDQNIWELKPQFIGQPFYQLCLKALETQEPAETEVYDNNNQRWYDIKIFPSANGLSVYFNEITNKKWAEEQIKAANERYELIAKATNDAIWDWDVQANKITGNSTYYNLYSSHSNFSEPSFEDFLERIHPDDKQRVLEKFNASIANKDTLIVDEFRFKISSGNYRFIYDRAFIIYGEDGSPIRMLGAMMDITDRKKTEETLYKSELRNRTLLNAIPDMMFVVSRDSVFLDYKAEEITDLHSSPIDFIGKKIIDILPAEIATKATELMAKAFATNELQAFEYELTHNNTLQSYEARISANTENNEAVFIIRNITVRKNTERNLIQSEKKYRILFDNSPMPKLVYDIHSLEILDVNKAASKKYGYTKEEFLKLSITDISPYTHADKLKGIEEIKHLSVERSIIRKHLTKSGKEILVEIFAHDIFYNNRQARMILAYDITLELEQNNQLRESARQLRELSAHLQQIREEERTTIAREIHDELGQQLTALKMDLAHLRKLSFNKDDASISKLDEAISNVDNTIKSVRKIATHLRPAIIDDLGLIAAMEWQAQDFEKRTLIKTEFIDNTGDIKISGPSAIAIFRIFQESLTNIARHAMAKQVNITINYEEGMFTLLVADDGIGFDEKEIRQKKSLGLLGIKERVLLLQGNYTIESKPQNGTVVKVSIPIIANSL